MDERQREVSWAAGFFDGEGYVGLSVMEKSVKSANSGGHAVNLRVRVANTDRRSLDVFRRLFGMGGRAYEGSWSGKSNHRVVYRWRVDGKAAHSFLVEVLPYLVIKREQAELAIRFWELPWRGRKGYLKGQPQTDRAARTHEQVAVDIDLARQVKALKRA